MSETTLLNAQETALFFDVIKERHSVRSYDPTVKISREEMNEMLQLATLAPSSSNLQPWRFLVIDSEELKQQLLPIAFNQQQVVEASAVIAILGDLKSYEKASQIYAQAVEAGYMAQDVATSFVDRTVSMYSSLSDEHRKQIVVTDGGLIAMQLMLIARAKGYDTVPMGGYDKVKFAEAYQLPDHYVSVMLLAIGKAAKPGHPTKRLPLEDVVSYNQLT